MATSPLHHWTAWICYNTTTKQPNLCCFQEPVTPKLPPTDDHEHPPATELWGRRVKIATVEGTMDSVEVDYELHSAPSSSISLVSCLCGSIAEHCCVCIAFPRVCSLLCWDIGVNVADQSPPSHPLSCRVVPPRPILSTIRI